MLVQPGFLGLALDLAGSPRRSRCLVPGGNGYFELSHPSRVTIKFAGTSTLSGVRAALGHRLITSMTTPRTYEITFTGEAVPCIVNAFEDFDVSVGDGTTTIRAQLPDQAAVHGTLNRLMALGLELLQLQAVDDQPFE